MFLPGESQGRGNLVGCHLAQSWTWLKWLSSSSSSSSRHHTNCFGAIILLNSYNSLWVICRPPIHLLPGQQSFFSSYVDHLKSLYWICYSIATVFSFFSWSHGTWDLSSRSCTLCIGKQSLNHWTTRKVPWHSLNSIPSTLWVAMPYGRGDCQTPGQSHDWPRVEPIKSLGCHFPCQWLVWNEHVVRAEHHTKAPLTSWPSINWWQCSSLKTLAES